MWLSVSTAYLRRQPISCLCCLYNAGHNTVLGQLTGPRLPARGEHHWMKIRRACTLETIQIPDPERCCWLGNRGRPSAHRGSEERESSVWRKIRWCLSVVMQTQGLKDPLEVICSLHLPGCSPLLLQCPSALILFNGRIEHSAVIFEDYCFISSGFLCHPACFWGRGSWLPKLSLAGCSKNANSLEY